MRRYLILLLTLLSTVALFAQKSPKSDPVQQLMKLNQVVKNINSMYVDDVDMAPLVESAIRAMLSDLDPHSGYIGADEMKSVTAAFEGEFSGIGVEFNVLRDTLIVVNTVAGGPAESVGVIPNDRIVAIDGKNVIGIKRADVPGLLRGKTGSRVAIGVVRHGVADTLDFIIVRDKIPLNTIDAAYKVDDRTGYIKVNRFGRTTMAEFREAFASLGRIDGLILDLSSNGGGLLDQAIDMASFFLPRGAAIVSTEGRSVEPRTFTARQDGLFLNGHVVVMINENTASGSEIVAGALQDWDRAVIIGQPSFGKGLVQRQMMLDDGSAVRITISRYHTPSGRIIQRPYENGKSDEYYAEHLKRIGDTHADTISTQSPMFKTLRNGRTVYGGGGIRPDILVEADTAGISSYLIGLVRKGVVNEYVITYLDQNRTRLKSEYPDADSFRREFEVPQEMFDGLIATGTKLGVEFDESGFDVSREFISIQLKAIMGQKLFSTTDFYRIINEPGDTVYKKALDILHNWDKQGAVMLKK